MCDVCVYTPRLAALLCEHICSCINNSPLTAVWSQLQLSALSGELWTHTYRIAGLICIAFRGMRPLGINMESPPFGAYRRLVIGPRLLLSLLCYRRLLDSFVLRRNGRRVRLGTTALVDYCKKEFFIRDLVAAWELCIVDIGSASYNMNLEARCAVIRHSRSPEDDGRCKNTFLLHVKDETLIVARKLLQWWGLSFFSMRAREKKTLTNCQASVVTDILKWRLRRSSGRHEIHSNEEGVPERPWVSLDPKATILIYRDNGRSYTHE